MKMSLEAWAIDDFGYTCRSVFPPFDFFDFL
jgi:hypothetical protein